MYSESMRLLVPFCFTFVHAFGSEILDLFLTLQMLLIFVVGIFLAPFAASSGGTCRIQCSDSQVCLGPKDGNLTLCTGDLLVREG